MGNRNVKGAVWTVEYAPPYHSLKVTAIVANSVMGASLATCLYANMAPAWLRPFAPPGLAGCGAMSLVGLAQTFYLTGQLSAQWMPLGYRQVASSFGWTVGQIRWVLGWAGAGQAGRVRWWWWWWGAGMAPPHRRLVLCSALAAGC